MTHLTKLDTPLVLLQKIIHVYTEWLTTIDV